VDENNFWLRLFTIITLSILVLFVTLILSYNLKVIRMAELGYQEVSYPGSANSYYQKVK
jgi:hypothetical protein